ncbi:hypothetical protein Tco_0910782 [Tanacetum coccineum]|uniref:Uncharacterized protein n=1 Tax=Tanacetum coccineum TaxID=301880 RepID=A0ABQ5CVF3_9ASTR
MSSKDAKEEDTGSNSNEDANLTAKQIKEQKRFEELVKADLAKQEVKLGRHELVDLLGIDVVKGFYKAKLQYDKHCDRMLNRRVQSRIKNYDVLTRKGPITLKDPLDKLNDLARKKRKHADDIHDYFRSTKKFKSSDFVTIEYFEDFSNEMMYTIKEIFFRHHQEPRLNDHARTFSSFLLAEVDKRNQNPLKQMRTIEQLRQ